MKRIRVLMLHEYSPGRTIEPGDIARVISDVEGERMIVARFEVTGRRFGVATHDEETLYVPRQYFEYI